MENTGTDVNTNANASDAGSSPAEGEVGKVESTVESGESAETLNTEAAKTPEHIPYSRFKEVNEAKKQLEEKMEKLGHYQQFDEILAKNPELFEKVKGALQEFTGHTQQDNNDPVGQLSNQVQQLVVQRNIDAYQNEFNSLTKDMSESERMALERMTEIEMYRVTQNPYKQYVPGLLKKSFENAKKLVDQIKSGEKASYVKAKENEVASATRGGVPAAKIHELDTRSKKVSYIANKLRAGN